jgi:RNA polymerase sigma-70 factor (ECF subfamily)
VYLSQDLDDAALVDRCRAGDSAAFGMLAERHRRVLQSVAYRLLGDREDAKDATQTTFVKALEHLDGYDPSRRFFSWVYAILRNECLNMLRARREAGPIDGELARGAGPLEAAEAAERHRHVQAALLALPVEQREVVVLRHFAGLSYEEIARAVGVPAKTVKSRLFTGRQRLGELLLGWEAQ